MMKGRMTEKEWNAGRILSDEEKREISNGTISRFEEYVNKELEKYEEMQKMEEVIKTQQEINKIDNPFDAIGGDYIRLERDKAKILLLTNWKVAKINKFKDDKGNPKEQMEFSADVLSEDGQTVEKIFAVTSFSALKGLKEVFSKYHPDSATPRLIRIKKIGEGRSTVYDVEEIKTK